jgi:hypothetical protein
MKRDLLNQIRELFERKFDVLEIAASLNVDLDTVRIALDIIKEIITCEFILRKLSPILTL